MSEPANLSNAAADLLASYRPPPGSYDELLDDNGQPREHWRRMLNDLAGLAPEQRVSATRAAARLQLEHEVAYIADGAANRTWHLDSLPLIIAPGDWAKLSSGLIQRAELLNAMLGDIYGEQSLLKNGQLPAPLIFGNPDFIPLCHGQQARDQHLLKFLAFDVGRAPDGSWWVLSQRTETPSGIGYALEHRLIASRALPDQFNAHNLHRLAGFFRSFADHFAQIGDQNRSVVLTGGIEEPDYFEHALIGRYLGYPVVESADLTVRDHRVFLKTLEGLERVDLIIRRIASETCDPLELRSVPRLGIAGLLHAARTANVLIANPLGSGVVESDALLSFMPGLCQHLLDEPLQLPSIASWWCGQPKERAYVEDNIDRLNLRRAFRHRGMLTAGAHELQQSDPGLEAPDRFREQLNLRPYDYVGLERMQPSTVPLLDDNGQLLPAPMVMRVFVAASENGYLVMPGGLVKVSAQDAGRDVAVSKDVWVLAEEEIPHESLIRPLRAASLKRSDRDLPSKTADDLFWLGRYFERADGGVRLYRNLFMNLAGETTLGSAPVALSILTSLLVSQSRLTAARGRRAVASGSRAVEQEIWNILFDPDSPDSLGRVLGNVRRTADQVRERLSQDAWRIIDRVTSVPRLRWRTHSVSDAVNTLNDLIEGQSAVNGLIHENMTRGYGWRLLDMGRRIERARFIIKVMRELLVRTDRDDPGVLSLQLELSDSLITYRARYQAEPQLPAVLDLVLADETNPRSLVFQLNEMADHMHVMPLEDLDGRPSAGQKLLVGMNTEVLLADVDKLAATVGRGGNRTHLNRLLNRSEESIDALTNHITQTYFSHSIGHRVTGNVIRGTPTDAV